MRMQIFGMAMAALLASGTVAAHHDAVVLGTITLSQPAMFGGVTLQPGTYEVRDAGTHPAALPGQAPDSLATIEFVRDGRVVASDAAEVMEGGTGVVGTSGAPQRLRVQVLRGGEYARIAASRDGERYLIHLALKPAAPSAAPKSEPVAPAR